MSIVPVESMRFELMEKVADLEMEGLTATEIAKRLDIKRKEVLTLQEDYREALRNDSEARDLARDHLNKMVKHYDKLIAKFYNLAKDLEDLNFSHQVAAQINSAYKAAAELEAKRVDLLQKAGLLDSAELGDELADMEEKQELLISILRNDLCPDCKMRVAHKLSQATNRVEVVAEQVIDV